MYETLFNAVGFVRLALATALVAMSVSVVGTLLSLASWPALQIIQEHANPLVTATVAVVHALSIGVVLWAFAVARSRGADLPPRSATRLMRVRPIF